MTQKRPTLPVRLWRDAPFLSLALLAALLVAGFFAARLTLATLYWTDPARQEVPLAAWMTPGFVAHSWDLPPELVATTLALDRDGSGRRVTLGELAKARGVPVETLIAQLEAAIAAHRGARP